MRDESPSVMALYLWIIGNPRRKVRHFKPAQLLGLAPRFCCPCGTIVACIAPLYSCSCGFSDGSAVAEVAALGTAAAAAGVTAVAAATAVDADAMLAAAP